MVTRRNPLSNMSTRGGIITAEFLETMRQDKPSKPAIQPHAYKNHNGRGPKNQTELDKQITQAWQELRERFDAITPKYRQVSLAQARNRWIIPLLKALGFDPIYNRKDLVLDREKKLIFKLSHRGWHDPEAPIIHVVEPSQELEERPRNKKVTKGRREKSPHDELQTYLNLTTHCKWGILTNGVLLRVLRKYYHTTTKGYVEFDLENIFLENSYTDFRTLYRITHASRYTAKDEEGRCWLEQFYEESIAAGVKIGEGLRQNVKKAIKTLGNGFLNQELADEMVTDQKLCKDYYAELLRIIYRILFLLFAEQRAMLPTRNSLYADEYSLFQLREEAERQRGTDKHADLWESLRVTFRMIKKGCPELKVFGYNGTLFDEDQTPILNKLTITNQDLFTTIRHLTMVEEEHTRKRINYLDLGVEEIGSIYESLLDYTPKVSGSETEVDGERIPPHSFYLDPGGMGRKTTGSYYTNPQLVDELIKSALAPVVEEKIVRTADKEKALLSVKVCDPACGSAAFLIAANNYLAKELARIRTGQPEPPDSEVREAKRDVLQHCIYGVDLNPMAVELAKVSLWINSSVENKPLNFLDHHIKCGNSLVGATRDLIQKGIPDEAFQAVEGDNKGVAKKVIHTNKAQRKGAILDSWMRSEQKLQLAVTEFAALSETLEAEPKDVENKRRMYRSLTTYPDYERAKFIADTWTAAFFWPLNNVKDEFPTQGIFRMIAQRGQAATSSTFEEVVSKLAQRYRIFQWHVEFPDVFQRMNAGFNVLLGNPPWEMINLMEKEFFADRAPEIANAPTGVERKQLIRKLVQTNPGLHAVYCQALRDSESLAHYLRHSERFPFTSGGRINTYAVFAELARQLVAPSGRAGLVVPTGIATDYTYRNFFADLVGNEQLVSLYDFENRKGLFPGTHRSYKFALLTLGSGGIPEAEFAFFLHTTDDLADSDRRFTLSSKDIDLINPNTHTVPILRTRRDVELLREIYSGVPVLVNERTGENPWNVSFRQGLFNMTSDSYLFRSQEKLDTAGLEMGAGARFVGENSIFLPLYEGRMIQHFDHRAASVGVSGETTFRSGVTLETSIADHADPCYSALPRFWVKSQDVRGAIPDDYKREWFLAFKDVTSPTNERTMICSVIPLAAVGNKIPLLMTNAPPQLVFGLIANLSAYVFDFIVRQKIGGVSLNFFIVKQLPVLPPDCYGPKLLEFIVPRVAELTYTAWDLQPFSQEILSEVGTETWARCFNDIPVHTSPPPQGHSATPPPFIWDEKRRIHLRAQLDAVYFRLYGITRKDVDYILETFPIVKRKDEASFGEYRTKNLILRYYDEYRGKIEPYDRNGHKEAIQ